MRRVLHMTAFDPAPIAELQDELPPEALACLLATFEADLGRLVAELVHAAQAGDRAAYLHAAHSLAGTAANVGLVGLAEAARVAMDPAQPEPPDRLLPRLLDAGREGLDALRAFIG